MRNKRLTLILLLIPVSSIYAQSFVNQDCDNLKNTADSAYRLFEGEWVNSVLQQPYDAENMYSGIYTFFQQHNTLFSSDCLTEDERQTAIEKLNSEVGQVLAGGVFFHGEREYDKAAEYFLAYVDFCQSEIATAENRQEELVVQITYYAILSSVNTDNHQRTIRLLERSIRLSEDLIKSGGTTSEFYELKDLYYLLALEYLKLDDEAKFVETVEAGITACLEDKAFFLTYLVNYYIESSDNKQALLFMDDLLQCTPQQSDEYLPVLNVKANLLVHEKEYTEAENVYLTGLKINPEAESLIEGLGVAYVIHAQALQEADDAKKRKVKKKIKQYYGEGLIQFEKYRMLLETRNADDIDKAKSLKYLANVYYNLNMKKKWQAIEEQINQH